MEIKVINKSGLDLPKYETKGSAGMDLKADIKEDIVIKPMERILVETGLYLEIPIGHKAEILPRSGLAIKHGITVVNAPGLIDHDYRGNIKVALINLSNESFTIKRGERIAQIVFNEYKKAIFIPSDTLGETKRGDGGFGHTGR